LLRNNAWCAFVTGECLELRPGAGRKRKFSGELKPQETTRLAQDTALVTSGLTIAIALAVLAGWIFHLELLKRFLPGSIAMNPMTACCLLAAAISLLLLRRREADQSQKLIGRFFAGVVLLVGALRLISIVSGWDLGLQRWLVSDHFGDGTAPIEQMMWRTALSLVLIGAALLLLDVQTPRRRRPWEILSALAAAIAILNLIGYSYGLISYYTTPNYVPASLPNSIGFLLLATGILHARAERGIMGIVVSDTVGGMLARRLIPLAILLPIFLGALRLAGERAGWYETKFGAAHAATAFIVLFLAAVWWTARILFRIDTGRKQAEDCVRHLNAELEGRVAERTADLHSLNEELQRASKAKDHFLAALSHELRTPLTPVLMCAASLERETALQPEFREQLGMMRRNVELEARLIDDLLDLTRISRGKLELQLGETDVHSLLAHTEQIVLSEARGKGLSLRFVLEAGEHVVAADAARLHQVFWNMVKNAIKFTPDGGQITVRTTNESGRIRIEVVDDGIGIEPKILPSVFGAFVQADTETGHTSRGLGLGMSISKTIVEMHGGTICAESAGAGEGATFTVELDTVSSPATGNVSAPATSSPSACAYRLLVVEDHQPTLDVLARLLRKVGHEVVTAGTVAGALHCAAQGQFDLVISDIGLPDGNGVDLMVQLTHDYGLRGIALSGYGMDADFARTKNAGFVAHLVKPIDFERLNRVLEQAARAA
jgi:signal transduction histidine kinase/CheY-like chemotaxis protein